MQALIRDNAVSMYPYTFAQLMRDNPQTSFPSTPTTELLEYFGVYEVGPVDPPPYESATHRIEEGLPALLPGGWAQTWVVIALTLEELAAQAAVRDEQRRKAYEQESDPLFFKWQRGEATQQQWLDKVAEIKAAYQ